MKLYVKVSRHRGASKAPNPPAMAEYGLQVYTQLWRDAAKEFVFTILRNTLVETGMSKGSVIPLAEHLRIKGAAMDIARAGIRKSVDKGVTYMSGSYAPDEYKSLGKGVELGENAYRITEGTVNHPIFSFSFKLTVWQHYFHETRVDSLGKAGRAFVDYLVNRWKDYLDKKALISGLMTGQIPEFISRRDRRE